MKKFIKQFKRCIPTSLMALLMLTSCATNTTNDNKLNNDKDLTRVDFNEVLKNLTIGYDESFNDSVLVSDAVNNAKIMNQEVTVIIEMDGDTTVDTYLSSNLEISYPEFYGSKQAIKQENEMVDKQSKLAAKLLKEGLIDEIYGNYSSLLNGFYARTTYGRVDQIRSYSNVKNAYVSTIYKQNATKKADLSNIVKNASKGVINNETNVYEETGIYKNITEYDGSNTIVAVLDSGFDYTHEVFSMEIDTPAKTKKDIEDILTSTTAYNLSKEELDIDDVYLSSKVPFAFDYAYKKADVFPVESDHGTHVSGIIGGRSDKIEGIAPNTQFAWMKVFNDDDGGGDSGDILLALEDSVTIGVDAINMSLGAVGGYSLEVIPANEINSLEERTNKIYKTIEDVGISLLTAAGNEYSSGYQSATGTNLTTNPESGTISSPGSYTASLTVASINGELDSYALANGSESEAVFFRNAFDSKQIEHEFIEELFQKVSDSNIPRNADGSVTLEYVTVPGTGIKANYSGLKVQGKIALVKRGTISFEEKLKYATQQGALACLIYNNVSGSLAITVGKDVSIPISLVSLEAGEKLAKKRNGTLTFKEDYKAGPFMSDFSSWGPLASLELKPEITAHGGNIYSATLGGSYDEMSGTSMATPNTCGIVLVIRDYVKANAEKLGITVTDGVANPKEVTNMVNRLLMSTANICLNEVGNPYSPRKQGAGLASLTNSVTTNAYLYVEGTDKPKLELKDDPNRTGIYVATFNVNNFSDKAISYNVGNYTQTETVSSDEKAVAETPYMFNPNMSISVDDKLQLNNNTVTVPANTDGKITVTLKLSESEKKYIDDNFKNGMYVEGFVTLNANDEKEIDLNIPYLAYYGSWLESPMFDVTYYDVEKDRVDASISEKDKTKADLFATTPYGKYGDLYMIPLGGYIYNIDPQYEEIAATQEKAAISIDSEMAIYQLYTIYTGMLRGAKKLTVTMTNDITGEVIFEKVTYNNRKALFYGAYGQTLPYNEDYSLDMFNAETGEVFANNTKIVINMKAELDYENGDQVANNSYEFSFYVDYETPTLENVKYITEWDKSLKENRYYMELDVSDNRFVQSIRPCTIKNNTLISLIDNPIPVYQQNPNETTTVKIEITDYFKDLKGSEYPDTIFFMINDYALNSNIFMVSLSGCDSEDLAFTSETIEVEKNQTINLNDYVNVENATLQGMTWTTSNDEIAIVDEAQVIGLKKGIAFITGTSDTYGTSIQVKIKVLDNDSQTNSYITDVRFAGYNTKFSFSDDFEYSQLGGADDEGVSYSYMPNNNVFDVYPSESFQLNVAIDPWYFDEDKVELRWTSSNSAYVEVSSDGVVTALKETITPITIRATAYIDGKDTLFSATTSVSVKSPFVTSGMVLQYYKGFGGVVEIPDDLGIEYIGEYAFAHYNYAGVDFEGIAIRIPIGDRKEKGLYSTPITKIIVPEGVKIIQNCAFMNLEYLEEVVLPSTAKDIYVSAFENCTSLEKINLNTINKIENYAFKNCKSLSNVNKDGAKYGNDLSNVVTMGREAFKSTALTKVDLVRFRMTTTGTFAECTNLKEVTLYKENPLCVDMFTNSAIEKITIPHSYIPTNAFANSGSIKEIVFTNENVVINEKAFINCNNLQTIRFADSCKSLTIGYNAFENSNINTLVLPSCEVALYDEAFKGSTIETLQINQNTSISFEGAPFVNTESFKTIKINGTNPNYEVVDNMLVNKNKDTLILVPANTEVVIPATIKTIEAAAIAGNNVTKSLVIPATVTTIKDFAFANSNIETLDLSNANNASFGNYVFYGCANLTTVNGLNSLDVIKEYMFAFSGLTQLAIADDVVIEYGAFAECDNLTNVTLGNNVTVGQYAFYGSFALESSVVIGSGTIGDYSFADSNINNVIANNVTSVGEGAFMQARNLAGISLQNVSELGLYAFYDADKLLTVDISNLTSIAYATFAECDELTTIISSKLSSIGDEAFMNAVKLSSIDLSKVTSIGKYSFYNCAGLTSIDLTSIKTLDDASFAECTGLTEVKNLEKSSLTVIPSNAFFHDTTLQTTSVLSSINLSKVIEIKENAFYGNSSLNSVNLANVESIENYAFYGTILNKLSLPKAKTVGHFVFYGCPIRELSIPSLVSVGECAFAEIYASKVDLPETLESIDYGSFSSITFVENYTHNGEANYTKVDSNNKELWKIIDGVLYTYLSDGKLQLQSYPVGSKRESYQIVEGTYRIDAYSFYTANNLKEVFIPYSLKSIGDCAFGATENLKTYHFNSYEAPILEGVYNYSLINYIYSLTETNETINNLYHIDSGKIYNMYYYYYPYYYANFYDYVGFVNDLTVSYPKNGIGYDSWIYRNYFATATTTDAVADNATNRAIDSLNKMFNVAQATIDNREDVLEAYNNYIVISSEEQKALLDEEKVNHLLKLYGQVIDIDYPSLTEEELNNVVGTYTGIDSEDTTFNLVINADGSGTFVVDHQTNDEQDKSLTFDKVRHYNDSTLQIITNDSSTFTFTIDENNNIVLKYYVSNVELNKSTNKKDTNTNNNALPIILGSVGGVIVVGGLAVAFILLRKKKVTGGK